MFLATSADIAFYGGAAGGGKSWALLFEPILHHLHVSGFGGVIFRRTTPEIENIGALWDESMKLYGLAGGIPHKADLAWSFPSGVTMDFEHLQHEHTVFSYQGAQIPYMGFDEITHFTRFQFFYMLSRNRSTCGVRPYIRGTCNPDPDSWVRKFIDWWIGKDGFPIQERSGVIRWFVNIDDKIRWADTKEELLKKYPESQPLSFTFIPAKLTDNKILMEKDPGYVAKLDAMGKVDRQRYKEGNWDVKATAGNFFKREWFPIVEVVPGGWVNCVRAWDRAATDVVEGQEQPSRVRKNKKSRAPDWSRGVKIFSYSDGTYCIADLKSIQGSPGKVSQFIKTVASHDGKGVKIRGYQDPGSAGVLEGEEFKKMLAGYDVDVKAVSNKKAIRAKPFSSQCEPVGKKAFGNVMVLRGEWNEDLFHELENFSEDEDDYEHDDIVDACSLAFSEIVSGPNLFNKKSLERLSKAFGGH